MRFHIINAVWGRDYTDAFLKVTLPSQLAPGNLPAFESRKQSIYRIFTTPADAETIRDSAAYARLSRLIKTEIVAADDIPLNEKYGASSEYHRRGIQAADDDAAAIIFLTPDTIWSAGTFPRIEQVAASGKRLLAVGGVRVVKETFVPAFLKRYYDRSEGTAAISGRELVKSATLASAYR